MQMVVHNHGINLKDLSREVSLAHSTVSGIMDRLVKCVLVERRSDPEDGCVARIYPAAAVLEFIRDRIPVRAARKGPGASYKKETYGDR
jgi:DNA-binding MarR family transcriptional regulator